MRSGLAIALLCLSEVASAQPASSGGIAARAEGWVIAAEEAVIAGDEAAAGRAIDLAWVYLRSPVFEHWWRAAAASGDRLLGEALFQRVVVASTKRAAIVAVTRLAAMRAEAVAAREKARNARPPASDEFRAAHRIAEACAAFAAKEADVFFETAAGLSMHEAMGECAVLAGDIQRDADVARDTWAKRDAELRAVLKGERLDVYEELGEPGGALAGAAAAVAKAKIWEFVIGPTGKLRTYETWVITFSGNKVVSRMRSRSHEAPP